VIFLKFMCRWYSDIQRLRIAELNNLNKRIITIKTIDLIGKIKDQNSELNTFFLIV